MQKLRKFVASVVAAGAIVACGLLNATTTPLPGTLATAHSGIPVSAAPIRLLIPAGLATGAIAASREAVTDQGGGPWDVAPTHLDVTLEGYALQSEFQAPQLFIYPAQQYAALNSRAAESITRIRAVLSNPNAQYTNDALPYVPFFDAGQVFSAQEKLIQFQGGSGIRVVTQYASDVSPIDNGSLFYHFEGLTRDGKYYIIGVLPTSFPFLPSDPDPDSPVPTGGVAFPQDTAPGSAFVDYRIQVANLLDRAPAEQFNPSLKMLDGLIESISSQ